MVERVCLPSRPSSASPSCEHDYSCIFTWEKFCEGYRKYYSVQSVPGTQWVLSQCGYPSSPPTPWSSVNAVGSSTGPDSAGEASGQ